MNRRLYLILFNLHFIESQFSANTQLQAKIETLESEDTEVCTKVYAMSEYYCKRL